MTLFCRATLFLFFAFLAPDLFAAIYATISTTDARAGESAVVTWRVIGSQRMHAHVRLVLMPELRVDGGSSEWEGELLPGEPVELRAVVTPLSAGRTTMGVRLVSGEAAERRMLAQHTLTVAPAEKTKPSVAPAPAPAETKHAHPRIEDDLLKATAQVRSVDLHFATAEAAQRALPAIRRFDGVRVTKVRGRRTRVTLPLDRLRALVDRVPEIQFVSGDVPGAPTAVTSEGVSLTEASAFHAAGVRGAGARVAILDYAFGGVDTAIAAGDLPSSVIRLDCRNTCVWSSLADDPRNHGTLVAEIVHDMAPQATLYLIRIANPEDMLDAALYCLNNGIHIITHSMAWTNHNFYDGGCWEATSNADLDVVGPVCATDYAVNGGILWVNSAGNSAATHYGATFTDVNANAIHDVAIKLPGVTVNELIDVRLTWDDWPLSDQDFDFFLYDGAGVLVKSSEGYQTGSQFPRERIVVYAPRAGDYFMRVKRYRATTSPRFKIHTFDRPLSPATLVSSMPSPADGKGVMSVGAISAWAYTTATAPESYSSRGPTMDGRLVPTLSGPTNVTTFTGGTFTGTSASAPHVAGAAALLKSANPHWTRLDLWDELTRTAVDMGAAGADTTFGYGRLRLAPR